MELVEGQDLRSRIRHSPVPLDELAVIGAGIADALAYVHSLGIIHRDVKPGNILLVQVRPGEPLRPKLTDFGIARIADGTRLTETGAMVGTAAYLSPEQAMGSPLTPASDVYSLGLVLLECIKQTVEYPGSAVESAVARFHRAPDIPAEVPAEWADLIRSLTAREPLERPSAGDVETALRQALVSPASVPGQVVSEPTRVLPAMPFRPPSIPAEPPAPEPLAPEPEISHGQPTDAPGATGHPRASSPPRARRFWRAAVLIILVLACGAAALTLALPPESTADVVPYPSVSGTLGDHLQELQKSVEP
jgi:serine/threonine protein kinase